MEFLTYIKIVHCVETYNNQTLYLTNLNASIFSLVKTQFEPSIFAILSVQENHLEKCLSFSTHQEKKHYFMSRFFEISGQNGSSN